MNRRIRTGLGSSVRYVILVAWDSTTCHLEGRGLLVPMVAKGVHLGDANVSCYSPKRLIYRRTHLSWKVFFSVGICERGHAMPLIIESSVAPPVVLTES